MQTILRLDNNDIKIVFSDIFKMFISVKLKFEYHSHVINRTTGIKNPKINGVQQNI